MVSYLSCTFTSNVHASISKLYRSQISANYISCTFHEEAAALVTSSIYTSACMPVNGDGIYSGYVVEVLIVLGMCTLFGSEAATSLLLHVVTYS